MSKALYAVLFAAVIAAAVSMPVANDVQDVQTEAQWGKIGKWITGNKKACKLQKCRGCVVKYKTKWGRRLLENDVVEAELSESTQWGFKKILPKKQAYTDCSQHNKCLAANAKCKGVISALKAQIAALDKEIAAAKKVAAAAGATAAEKAKVAKMQAAEARAAKHALAEEQKRIANLAATVAAEMKDAQVTKDKMKSAVKHSGRAVSTATKDKARADKALAEFNAKMAAPGKRAKKGAATLKLAKERHEAQKASAAKANAKEAADIAKARAELKKAQAGLGKFAAKHRKEAGEAGKAAAEAKAAKEMHDVKKSVVKMHQKKRNSVAKRVEQME